MVAAFHSPTCVKVVLIWVNNFVHNFCWYHKVRLLCYVLLLLLVFEKDCEGPPSKCCFYHLNADIGILLRLAGKGEPVLLVLGWAHLCSKQWTEGDQDGSQRNHLGSFRHGSQYHWVSYNCYRFPSIALSSANIHQYSNKYSLPIKTCACIGRDNQILHNNLCDTILPIFLDFWKTL